jgi:membrane fusion protein (multidrug efflux system)
MKLNLIPTLVLGSILIIGFSCGGGEANPEIEKLIQKRDSLKALHADIGKALSEVENQIAKLDTSIERRYVYVTLSDIEKSAFEHSFQVHGNVEADASMSLYPEMPGNIKKVYVNEGQSVTSGQVLAELDLSVLYNQREEIKTSYELAKQIFEKQEKLWKDKIGSEVQYLEAKTRKESLESTLAAIDANIKKGKIIAPVNGTVDEIFMNGGELANPALPVIRLVNANNVYIKADVSEEYTGIIEKGTKVKVEIPSVGFSIDTVVSHVSQFINPNNRSFKVRVDLENKKQKLKPNLLAILSITDLSTKSDFVVPSKAVQQDIKGNNYVFIADKKMVN